MKKYFVFSALLIIFTFNIYSQSKEKYGMVEYNDSSYEASTNSYTSVRYRGYCLREDYNEDMEKMFRIHFQNERNGASYKAKKYYNLSTSFYISEFFYPSGVVITIEQILQYEVSHYDGYYDVSTRILKTDSPKRYPWEEGQVTLKESIDHDVHISDCAIVFKFLEASYISQF